MLRELASSFNKTGEIVLKANREGPMTIVLRFQTACVPDDEAKALMGWTKRANYVWLTGSGAVIFLKSIQEYVSNEYGMRSYLDLTLEILGLSKGKERQSKLAQHRHRTKLLMRKRYGKVNWRKVIFDSQVAKELISKMVAASLLRVEGIKDGPQRSGGGEA